MDERNAFFMQPTPPKDMYQIIKAGNLIAVKQQGAQRYGCKKINAKAFPLQP